MFQLRGRRSRLLVAAAVVGVLGAGAVPGRPASAAGPDVKQTTSLKFIPADAAFYTVLLRNREQFEAVVHSNAWARLKALPLVQQGLRQFDKEFSAKGKMAPLYHFHQQPENRELLALLGDMVSDEVFIYGNETWAGFTELAQDVYWSAQFGRLSLLMRGGGQLNRPQMVLKPVLDSLKTHLKLLRTPDLILGFKVHKPERATAQLHRLEKLLRHAFKDAPQLKDRLKREKIAGSEFLTLRLSGDLVPWDNVPLKDVEETEGEYTDLVNKLKGLQLTLSAGVRDGYVLLSVGESNAQLARLGQGKLLAEREEFRPLAKFADKRITSLGYVSRRMNAHAQLRGQDVEGLAEMAKGFLPEGVTREQRDRITRQVKELAKEMKAVLPNPGALSFVSFLNGRGYEAYFYDWTKYPLRDGSKPLTLLHHAGGEPLLVTVGRSKTSLDKYRMFTKMVRVGKEFLDAWVQAKADEDDRDKYQKFMKAIDPVCRRFDEVTAKYMVPALADGQVGFVLDARLKSKQWIKFLPETEAALPLLEPALIVGVSDQAKLREGFRQYRTLANEFLAKLHEVDTDRVPELKIPRPKTRQDKAGTLYFYPLPEEWGLDPQLAPTAGLSDKVLAMTLSRKHTRRLLAATPLKVGGGPLANTDRPLAEATYFSMARTVDALTPWIKLGVRTLTPKAMRVDEDDAAEKARADQMVATILGHADTILEVLKVFRSYSSATYLEDGVWVTRYDKVIRDLPSK
jgi:hypothetical protein